MLLQLQMLRHVRRRYFAAGTAQLSERSIVALKSSLVLISTEISGLYNVELVSLHH